MTELVKIPLFPLGVVLLPGMHLPLHIFEERYKEMISECLAEDRPFGIVLFDGGSIRSVGCMAQITKVLKRYDDGRMDIMTRGGKRFVIREMLQDRSYMEARIFFFDDALEDAPARDLEQAVDAALKLIESSPDIDTFPSAAGETVDPKPLAFAIAAMEGFTPAERQGILEMTSPFERLEKCVQALSRIEARNRLNREIRQLIGGNGHPTKSILRELEERLKG
ncbi:LON peptidase substrate-binding domain-containing protein [uncultured Desulfosarcina sp.]|uniref:LON peptidase substrate-binding domain-containing protein n=1 Tax=uncultured Desulfosarcina sp. TaxID=218289 RepID=UPI0029C94667|nr:LON peptidase substrate-binding domain-containing protein [uncultured Desulfosarcina sp.]